MSGFLATSPPSFGFPATSPPGFGFPATSPWPTFGFQATTTPAYAASYASNLPPVHNSSALQEWIAEVEASTWAQATGIVLAVYAVAALVTALAGPPWLRSWLLCWPELCDGRGNYFYRILCSPCVLLYNATRIFCCQCCCTYLSYAWLASAFKGCLWGPFEDKDFPPDDSSIGHLEGDTASGVLAGGGATEWASAAAVAEEVSGHPAQLFEGQIEAGDMLQGALGDCWLIAALACVAERPEILQNALLSTHIDPRGKYYVRLWNQIRNEKGTKWETITIDDKVPVYPGELRSKFTRTESPEIWPMIMEKAFAKMYGGYDKLEGGQMSWALTAITGNESVHFYRESHEWKAVVNSYYTDDEPFSDDDFFKFLRKMHRNRAFICCAGIAQADRRGLIDGHAYSVMELRTERCSSFTSDYFRFVKIRNPHGGGEWLGAWSDRSETWAKYPDLREKLLGEGGGKEDGSFWMQWEDFIAFWKGVQVVDCDTNIKTVATPVYDENECQGPAVACLEGCASYWCCCLGAKRLYFGRKGATDVAGMKADMNRQCGIDQEGVYCNYCERKAVAYDSDESGSEEHGHE